MAFAHHFMLVHCSIHYNRIHPAYWRDRLMRVKSMGLNAVQVSFRVQVGKSLKATFLGP